MLGIVSFPSFHATLSAIFIWAYRRLPRFAVPGAIWAGLTPVIVDVDPHSWAADPDAEDAALATHGADGAVLLPYATFGAAIDLERYTALSARKVGVVVDAASSLGVLGIAAPARGRTFLRANP